MRHHMPGRTPTIRGGLRARLIALARMCSTSRPPSFFFFPKHPSRPLKTPFQASSQTNPLGGTWRNPASTYVFRSVQVLNRSGLMGGRGASSTSITVILNAFSHPSTIASCRTAVMSTGCSPRHTHSGAVHSATRAFPLSVARPGKANCPSCS